MFTPSKFANCYINNLTVVMDRIKSDKKITTYEAKLLIDKACKKMMAEMRSENGDIPISPQQVIDVAYYCKNLMVIRMIRFEWLNQSKAL